MHYLKVIKIRKRKSGKDALHIVDFVTIKKGLMVVFQLSSENNISEI